MVIFQSGGQHRRNDMKAIENLEDTVLGPFFPGGYVIRLGNDQYFWKWEKRKIRCAPFALARCFKTEAAAKRYADRCLWYEGMNPRICHIRWYLAYWRESETAPQYYHTGGKAVLEWERALSFEEYDSVRNYQQEKNLLEVTYLDFAPFDLETLSAAA